MEMMACKEALARFVMREMEQWDFSGVVRVIEDGAVFWEACRGEAVREFGIRNDCGTRFALGSVTKQFTAFAVMLLADRGLVELDHAAREYLPADWPVPADITVHHLLSHTSGLYHFYNFEDDFYIGQDRLPFDRERYVRDWVLRKPIKAPGAAYQYNNANYNLLAWIIEQASGLPYAAFLEENIFAPLGMSNTVFDDGMAVLPGKANNYMHDGERVVRVPYMNNLFHVGAGSLVSNCDDLQKWFFCLRERKLLSEAGYRRFFSENMESYCYGLQRRLHAGGEEFFHGGDLNGLATITRYFFEEDLCILILSNNDAVNQYRLSADMAEILHGGTPKHTEMRPAWPVSQSDLEKLVGTYLPGKIRIEVEDGRVFAVRVNQNIRVELYCVGPGDFMRRHEEQGSPYHLLPEGEGVPALWGYRKMSDDRR